MIFWVLVMNKQNSVKIFISENYNDLKFLKIKERLNFFSNFGPCKTKPFDGQTLTENTKGWDTPRPNLYYCEICKCAYLVAFRFLKHPACALLF